jgi:hypothetical protein
VSSLRNLWLLVILKLYHIHSETDTKLDLSLVQWWIFFYLLLLYIWYLVVVEYHTWLPHAEVQILCIHVVLDIPIIKQFAYVML